MPRKDPILVMIDCLEFIPMNVPEWRINNFLEEGRPVCLEVLKKRTGQDFGYDHDAWRTWYLEHYEDFSPKNANKK